MSRLSPCLCHLLSVCVWAWPPSKACLLNTPVCNQLITSPALHTNLSSFHQPASNLHLSNQSSPGSCFTTALVICQGQMLSLVFLQVFHSCLFSLCYRIIIQPANLPSNSYPSSYLCQSLFSLYLPHSRLACICHHPAPPAVSGSHFPTIIFLFFYLGLRNKILYHNTAFCVLHFITGVMVKVLRHHCTGGHLITVTKH